MHHVKDGLTFERLPDASVQIRKDNFEQTIPPAEWASVVAAMSARGETWDTYSQAKALHGLDYQ